MISMSRICSAINIFYMLYKNIEVLFIDYPCYHTINCKKDGVCYGNECTIGVL